MVERLIDAVCAFDYPKDRLEIQVLDDSTDETSHIVREKVAEFQSKGIRIHHVKRTSRDGFKAGALAHGLEFATGEFIAIFDADFLPPANFLRATLPYFIHEKTGLVQTRWTHINENNSLLTMIQSIFLNTHFTIEQMGRSESKAFINFNGTAGVWRKSCIVESGGWQADTLTEDLDLSFRAQLKGWEFEYLLDQESPAELPDTLLAFKVQQFRWSKGAAECSKKNLGPLFRSKSISFIGKIIGAFHLLNSSTYIIIFGFILLSLPLAYFFEHNGANADPLGMLYFIYITSVLLFVTFLTGNLFVSKNKLVTFLLFPILFPLFLMTSMGISMYLMSGVIEGYLGKKTEFVRTPKFNVMSESNEKIKRSYHSMGLTPIFFLEIGLLAYCVFSILYTYQVGNISLLTYVLFFTAGLSYNIIASIFQQIRKG